MNRIDRKFKELKKNGKKAFIAFITAGYPDLKITEQLILEFSRIGVDIIELGVAFSDPLADGPVIQESSKAALEKGVCLDDIFDLVKRVRAKTQIPICLMTYYNPVYVYGEEHFARKAAMNGVDGVIVPDLTPEEAVNFRKYAVKNKIDTVFFAAPTTTCQRLKFISRVSTGFIYYVSLTGVTGPRASLPEDCLRHIRMIKQNTDKPVCVGFGISSARQAGQMLKAADGVIVGSAIVKKIKENIGKKDLVKRIGDFVRGFQKER